MSAILASEIETARRMPRVHVPDGDPEKLAILEGPEAHHILRVLRMAEGDEVEAFDGEGCAWRAKLGKARKDCVELEPCGGIGRDAEVLDRLILACATPKGDRFDWLVEKATEIGVDELWPLLTRRTVVDPGAGKVERLRRRVIEACKQCGRNRLMRLREPARLEPVLEAAGNIGLGLIGEPGGEPLAGLPWGGRESGADVVLAIGPEGGWDPEEIALVEGRGWRRVDLGRYRLRIETAAIVGAALVRDHMATGPS